MRQRHLLILLAAPLWVARAQLCLPWHIHDASRRTVFQVHASNALSDVAIQLPLPPGEPPAAYLDPASPGRLLPAFRQAGSATLVLPGPLVPGSPRHIVAYSGTRLASPPLACAPRSDDFAAAALKRPWDFEDGTLCGIASWGNGPEHIGALTVSNGWLRVPVKGTDPYVIFGDMFGPAASPRGFDLDSSSYRTLELRVRQSCPQSDWSFFVTDREGRYTSHTFRVAGTAAQTFTFDLRALFPDFWDGRRIRALRLDTTNDEPGCLAEIDHVRLLPAPPALHAGPTLSREEVTARAALSGLRVALPGKLTAGDTLHLRARSSGTPEEAPVRWSFAAGGRTWVIPGTASSLDLPALTQAGTCAWRLGLSDDAGFPLPGASGETTVRPGQTVAYRLLPERGFVDLAAASVAITVTGLDRYGNSVPVSLWRPRWSAPGDVRLPRGRLAGFPARVTAKLPEHAAGSRTIRLTDSSGRWGETEVTTVAYRKDSIRLSPGGYLTTRDGGLFFPCGGLYANWPHRLPDSSGTISRALDLFPCGATPYLAGYPWSAQTEAAVQAYLEHCSKRGMNALRLMLRNMDLAGRADPVQLQAVLHLFDLARPLGLRFNVVLFEDYDKPPYVSPEIMKKLVKPRYTEAELDALPPHRARFLSREETLRTPALRYTDPDAIACQKDYLRELIPVLASREEVLCYELENEMVYPPMSWCREMSAFIRAIDPHTLILGNPGPHDWPEPLRWRESGCDLFSYHPYTDGMPAADHGALVFLKSKFAAQSRLPMYTGEGGINQNRWQNGVRRVQPEASARGARDQIWMSVCCGAAGALYWTLDHDSEAREFASVQPALDALGLDLPTFGRRRPEVALVLPAKLQARPDAAFATRLLELGVDFDTVATNEASAYAVQLYPEALRPEGLALPATVAAPAKGWHVATLVSADGGRALLYLRNVAGGVKDFGAPPRPCHLRHPLPAEAAITLRPGWLTATVFDCDTRRAQTLRPDAAGRISLGISSHDFLVSLRR